MDLLDLLTRWGILLVFLAVLLEQMGLPLPAAPILVSAGALAQTGVLRPEQVLLVAFAACLAADQAWFALGRRHGRQVLAAVCRLSLSPDTCVRRTDDLFGRHGPVLLVFAKFVPGVSAVAIPTAAAMGLSYRRFLAFDAAGCALWAGVYVGAGMIFSREIQRVLAAMSVVGGWALVAIAALFSLYIAGKLATRLRLRKLHRLVRISPRDMAALLAEEGDVVILDARSALARAEDPRLLPGAIVLEDRHALDVLSHGRRDQTIVTFCTCPNEASAALLADQLLKAGYGRVRVLTGGADALAVLSVEPAA
jgi:membrane protein DedA with SNARE-associated domain/rhodanese-related sulfurtransferase